MKRPIPAHWTKRICPKCNDSFRPMTDAMWKNVLRIHLITDKKHA